MEPSKVASSASEICNLGQATNVNMNATSLVGALSAEQAYAQALEGVIASIQESWMDKTQTPSLFEAQQAKLELLQRQVNAMTRKQRRRARTVLPSVGEDDSLDSTASSVGEGVQSSQLSYTYNSTLAGFLGPYLQDCKIMVYGRRSERLAYGMCEQGLDATFVKNTFSGDVSAVGRNGRPLAILQVVAWKTVSNGIDWFIHASDALCVGGIHAVLCTEEDCLEILGMLSECCGWETEIADDPAGNFSIIVMKKGLASDALLRQRHDDIRAACRDAANLRTNDSQSGRRTMVRRIVTL